jgi:heme oxygenase (biliverdin-producing, ferredoxin)
LHEPSPVDLTQRLRLDTRDLHAQTERTGAMAELLAGRLSREGYAAMLANLLPLYRALEAGLQRADAHPASRLVDHPALHRSAALAADLQALQGADGPARWPPLAATQAYVQRLQQLAQARSPLLVAHAYTRFLGDLHGGQILKRLVARALGLAGDAGTRFYDFGDEPQVMALRQGLRQALSQLPLRADEADATVAEARWSFLQHQALFSQLAGTPPAESV